MRTDIKRTALNITTYCNLNCKHCLAFIPYYDEKFIMSLEDARKILRAYFQIVDTVEHFTVTGGEPLLNQDCAQILEEVHKYDKQITGSVDFVTNGTLEIPDSIISVLVKHRDKTKVVLSNYGENLSKKIDVIEDSLKQHDIPYRISKFYGEDLYYDGWIDFSNHDLKWKTIEERDKNAQKCLHRIGKYCVINDGELHCCSRSYWRIRQGIIPKIKGEFVPILDESISLEEKRQDLIEMFNKKSSTSCAYCVGLCNGVPRVKPAQQL